MSDTFTVLVGKNKKEFTLYTGIAKRSSKFFQTALAEAEAGETSITLRQVKEDIFEGYLQWLNTTEITFTDLPYMLILTRFYVLGELLDDSAFRSAVLDRITYQVCTDTSLICSQSAALVWTKTRRGSPLRKLFLEICASAKCLKTLMNVLANHPIAYPKAFVFDLLQHLVVSRGLCELDLSDEERVQKIQKYRRALKEQ